MRNGLSRRPLAAFLLLAAGTLALAGCGGGGGGGSGSAAPASSDKAITSFSVDKPATSAVIDEAAKTIVIEVPFDDQAWLASEVVTFTTTGASVKIGGVAATSGVSTVDLYGSWPSVVVTAQDGSTATYTLVSTLKMMSWGWMKGSALAGEAGTYGSLDVAAPASTPGARWSAASWRDASGKLWLFGGHGRDADGNDVLFNDLWLFDGTDWVWKGGANTPNQPGTYGSLGVAAAGNVPGAREGAATWVDSSGNLWLFGGQGFDKTPPPAGSHGVLLNDLWKFDGSQWTWMGGPDTFNASPWGTYGTQGSFAAANLPGVRREAVAWRDGNDHLWLFGGIGDGEYDAVTAAVGQLNDLWEFDGAQWRWVSGSKLVKQNGTYGTRGTAAAGNTPGARNAATGWVGADGSFWLFGGEGYAATDPWNGYGQLGDLWKFDGSQWTWVSGPGTANNWGAYGDPGNNAPGGRYAAAAWTDASGGLWLFGGIGYDLQGNVGHLNDAWKFDGSAWRWMGGSLINAEGAYAYPDYYRAYMGTPGVSAPENLPSGRAYAASWVDTTGHPWLFGGVEIGYYAPGAARNDLWQVTP